MPHDFAMTWAPDETRAQAWAIDRSGRVREGGGVAGAVADGWVDADGGVGRVERVGPSSGGVDVLGALGDRYPGVRWLADRDAV